MSLEVGSEEAALRADVERSAIYKWRKKFGVLSETSGFSIEEKLHFAQIASDMRKQLGILKASLYN